MPGPEALMHLRPTNADGSALVAFAAGATALAVWLSSSGGWLRWAIGQALLAAALVQWFAVLHECGHRTMFRARRLNTVAGVGRRIPDDDSLPELGPRARTASQVDGLAGPRSDRLNRSCPGV